KYPLEQILQPLELTAGLCQMHWMEPFVLYWSRNVSDIDRYQHAEQYRQWLNHPLRVWGEQGGQHGDDQ
ncbi:glutathione-regulated potassium-efflux system ancillary protein KefG, partial [Vibrio owensii]